ncbi:MAG: TetR/AcrR family transcriptional regulator [Caldisericia bacterium]
MSSNKRSTDGFNKRREAKKTSVIDSANELFSKFGPEKVSIAEIAAHAKVSPVTIYNHFGSKDELIIKLIRHTTDGILERYKKISESGKSFPEKIDMIFAFKRENALSDRFTWITKASATNKHIRDELQDYFDNRTKGEMLKLITQGKNENYINPELSDAAVMIFLDIFVNYYLNNPDITNRIVNDEKLMREVYSTFWWGLDGERRDIGRE